MADLKASIDIDELLDRPLGEITAAQFIGALSSDRLDGIRWHLADKKKYELWVDETVVDATPLREVIERIKVEKKKLELEVPWDRRWLVDPPPEFVAVVAEKVAERLRG